jgi:hypothetical protein
LRRSVLWFLQLALQGLKLLLLVRDGCLQGLDLIGDLIRVSSWAAAWRIALAKQKAGSQQHEKHEFNEFH